MRNTILSLLTATLAVPIAAQHTSTLDDPIRAVLRFENPRALGPCANGHAIDQVARGAHVLVGFENSADCWLSPRSLQANAGSETLRGMSARQAFDHLIDAMPAYSWKELNGVIVVRPRTAWADPDNFLNQPVRPFVVTDQYTDVVLHTVLEAAIPSAFIPHRDIHNSGDLVSRTMTVAFAGGTMLDALNAIVRTHNDAEWQVGYIDGQATIVLNTLAFPGDHVMAPASLPQQHR